MSDFLIQLENVSLRRAETVVLHNLNFTLQPGQHWAILGENGAGKSSLLLALAGKIPVVGGTLRFGAGLSAKSVELLPSDFRFNHHVAASAQFYQQRYNSQAAENSPLLRAVLQGQLQPPGTTHAASYPLPPPRYSADWLAEVADLVQVSPILDRPLAALSNGETRRALLALSLLKRPRILLLDGPFAGLDAGSRAKLRIILTRLAATGTTLVVATTPGEIPACLSHALTLAGGTIAGQSQVEAALSAAETRRSAPPERVQLRAEVPKADFEFAVNMRGVSVRYGGVPVLQNLDWTVLRGEKWAVLGPNGSGKSTLLSLITADNPQGYANDFELFDKKRGSGESIWDIKGNIGFVSPELHLYFPRDTPVWQCVASGLFDATGLFRRLSTAQAERVDFILKALAISPLKDMPFAHLSTGQQRWVLLARALVKNPPLLILDEPAQGLDPAQALLFRELVDALCRDSARTLLYVSHYEADIPRCVDRVLRLEAGRGRVESLA